MGVGELAQDGVVANWLEEGHGEAEGGIDEGGGVADVEVEGGELEAKVELGVVVERARVVGADAVFDGP